jgi:hypothetical protein
MRPSLAAVNLTEFLAEISRLFIAPAKPLSRPVWRGL